jgi:thymidylate kinase
MVKKILVEGLDYSGKTTLCKNLVNGFKKISFTTKYNKGNIIKNCLNDYTQEELYSENSDLIKLNALLTIGPLIDSIEEKNMPNIDYFIQESYIDRTIAYNKVNNIPFFSDLLENVYDNLLQFDVSFFLTTNINERKKRYEIRIDERNKYDNLIFQDPKKFEEMNQIMKNLVVKRPNSYIIDTTNSTPKNDYLKAFTILRGYN